MVAPRIVGLPVSGPGAVARYEADFSSGHGPARGVGPAGWSRCVCAERRNAGAPQRFPGFDEDLRVAEDVDLCWRMAADGWRLRYDPVARVAHEHRVSLSTMLDRRRFYGTGATAGRPPRSQGRAPW